MASSPLPPNVHVSTHPCLRAKLSQLRSKDATCRETKALVNDIALILGCEALASCLVNTPSGTVSFYTSLGQYNNHSNHVERALTAAS